MLYILWPEYSYVIKSLFYSTYVSKVIHLQKYTFLKIIDEKYNT